MYDELIDTHCIVLPDWLFPLPARKVRRGRKPQRRIPAYNWQDRIRYILRMLPASTARRRVLFECARRAVQRWLPRSSWRAPLTNPRLAGELFDRVEDLLAEYPALFNIREANAGRDQRILEALRFLLETGDPKRMDDPFWFGADAIIQAEKTLRAQLTGAQVQHLCDTVRPFGHRLTPPQMLLVLALLWCHATKQILRYDGHVSTRGLRKVLVYFGFKRWCTGTLVKHGMLQLEKLGHIRCVNRVYERRACRVYEIMGRDSERLPHVHAARMRTADHEHFNRCARFGGRTENLQPVPEIGGAELNCPFFTALGPSNAEQEGTGVVSGGQRGELGAEDEDEESFRAFWARMSRTAVAPLRALVAAVPNERGFGSN